MMMRTTMGTTMRTTMRTRMRTRTRTDDHWGRKGRIAATKSSTFAMAPTPVSPQARVFATGGMTPYPHLSRVSQCVFVTGWFHMAGATATGLAASNTSSSPGKGVNSHARATHVTRLSASPVASLARLLASRGAIRYTSAHLRSSMWTTSSPISDHDSHSAESGMYSGGWLREGGGEEMDG